MKRLLPRTADETVISCVFLVILAVACMMPMQNDTWWHLRTGKEMWTRRFVMLSDEYSFTAAGTPWLNHEWLSDIIFYALYFVGGLPLLTFAAACMVTAAVALSWRLTDSRMDEGQRMGLLALALTSIVPVWTVRPHVFTLVGVMLLVYVALRGMVLGDSVDVRSLGQPAWRSRPRPRRSRRCGRGRNRTSLECLA